LLRFGLSGASPGQPEPRRSGEYSIATCGADYSASDSALYRAAQAAQAEHLDAEIQSVAETAVDRETASAARVRIAALQWRASKQAPKKFGDRLDLNVDHSFDLAAELTRRREQAEGGRLAYDAPLSLAGTDQ
jgi:hypothetical protein